MIKFLRQLLRENILLQVTSFNTIAIGVRIVAGLVSSKVIAFYLGASGMALLGDLRNFLNSVQQVSTLGITNGIVKYTAEFKNKQQKLGGLLSTAFFIGAIATGITALLLYFGASYWNSFLFDEQQNFTFIFKVLALALPFYAVNTFLIAVINGYAKFKWIVILNAVTNILGLIVTVSLIYTYTINGAFIAVVSIPALALIVTSVGLIKKTTYLKFFQFANVRFSLIKKLASYTGMTFFSAIASPFIFIGIRQKIIDTEGLTNAGYWDAMLRISDYYLMFVTSVLSMYVLPKLSETNSSSGFRKEVFNFYKTILPLFALGLIAVFFLKNPLIRLIFTEDFLNMTPIFAWQLTGDLFRVAALVIAYQFIAKNMFWTFIITQIFSLSIIYFSSIFFIDRFGFVGAGMGHALSYFIYLVVVLFIFRKALLKD